MLAALLPGVREVRTALVSGYLWLGTVILIVAAHSPSALHPPYPVSPGLRRLGELMGQGGVLAAFSIASLLCGQAIVGMTGRAINILNLRYVDRTPMESLLALEADAGKMDPMGRDVFRPFTSRAIWRVIAYVKASTGSTEHLRWSLRRIYFLSGRIAADAPPTYVEYDRMMGEADIRDAVCLPLPFFTAALLENLRLAGWGKLIIFIAVLSLTAWLFVEARHKARSARGMIAHRVVDLDLDIWPEEMVQRTNGRSDRPRA
jgi:hypothetical protein